VSVAAEREARFPIGASATLDELASDPHALLARLRAEEPVSWLPVLQAWVVSRRDLVLAVMRDAETFTVDDPRFSTGQVVGPSMLSLDGDEHARHRGPFARPFRLDEVRARFTAFVEAEADRLVSAVEPAGEGELRRAVAGPLAAAVMARSLGLDPADTAAVLGWYDRIVDAVAGVSAGRPVTADGHAAFAELDDSIRRVLRGGDGSSLLEAARADARGLDDAGVVSNAGVILFGGIETTEGMIANAVYHLLANPSELGLVRADPSLLTNAVEESLRLEPAAAVVDRYATRDVELAGAAIAERDLVTVSLAGANRDPATFADPNRFDVRRDNARHHVAFAQGPHVCPGMHLARIETEVAVRRVLQLPGLRLDPARDSAPRGLVFRKPPGLHALWDA